MLPLPVGDGEEKSSLFSPSFSPFSSTLHLLLCSQGRLHCNLPSLLQLLCGLLPPPHISLWHFILPVPLWHILHVSIIITPISSPPLFPSLSVSHSKPSCLLRKMSVLLCLISAPSPFILVIFYSSSHLFLHITLQLGQTPSLYVPNNISLLLFRKEAENSSYHPSMISLWLKNADDN